MNELVVLAGAPGARCNSLIVIGLTLRTFPAVVSTCFMLAESVHRALATRSPFQAARPEVIVNVALTFEPGGTEPNDDGPRTTAVHRAGTAMLRSTPDTGE